MCLPKQHFRANNNIVVMAPERLRYDNIFLIIILSNSNQKYVSYLSPLSVSFFVIILNSLRKVFCCKHAINECDLNTVGQYFEEYSE